MARIRGAIVDELRAADWVPRSVRAKARAIEAAYQDVEARLHRVPTDEELAAAAGLTVDQLHIALSEISATGLVALDEATALGDVLADRAEGPAGCSSRWRPGRCWPPPSNRLPRARACGPRPLLRGRPDLAQIGDGLGRHREPHLADPRQGPAPPPRPPGGGRTGRLTRTPGTELARQCPAPVHLAAQAADIHGSMEAAMLRPLAPGRRAAQRRPPSRYVPPVDAPIVDHFRPPACTWCPGNRGIDYATAPGTPVGASAAGVVTFAGQVGGQLFVVVAHADGLRTTYAYLATVSVQAGQRVAQGDVVGTAGATLHFGVRRGDVYLDPELLFAGGRAVARLVPLDGRQPARAGPRRRWPDGCWLAGERAAAPASLSRRPSNRVGHDHVRRCSPVVALRGAGRLRTINRGRRRANHHGPGRHDAPAARGRCPLRAPDAALEPEDEALHLR